MTRKNVLIMILLALLIGTLTVALNVLLVRGIESIVIYADGTIYPSRVPISRDGDKYTFTDNIKGRIEIRRNNITIDGNGYSLQGSGSETGFYLFGRNNITIMNTHIRNFLVGIGVHMSFNNNFTGNYIADNELGVGFYRSSSNNLLYHNNFINNTKHVYIDTRCVGCNFTNSWQDLSEGNYWSNYTGIDVNRDGLGDIPHEIAVNNTDRHPLMGAFYSFNTTLKSHVELTSNSTIEAFEYFESNTTIRMQVSNSTFDQTYGFVRIRIPHALMNETYSVTIDGAEPYYVNYLLFDDGQNRWIYFSYRHSTIEIVIIPEFSLLILPFFIIATLLATIVYKKNHS